MCNKVTGNFVKHSKVNNGSSTIPVQHHQLLCVHHEFIFVWNAFIADLFALHVESRSINWCM